MMRIRNGGIEAGLLRAAKDSGCELTSADEKRLEYLEGLPTGVDIYLDENGMEISKDEVLRREVEFYKTIKTRTNEPSIKDIPTDDIINALNQ